MNDPHSDWLDAVLKNQPHGDDGFADRVLVVDRARRRSALLLRALVTILTAGIVFLVVGFGAMNVILRWRLNMLDEEPSVAWLDAQRAAFREAFIRLDAHPALQRRSGRDASAVLDPAVAALERLAEETDGDTPCESELETGVAAACDTSFLVGLAAYDQWRAPARRGTLGEQPLASSVLVDVAQLHLRRAAAQGDDAFAAAAHDVEALARLALGHSPAGVRVLLALHDELQRARVSGRPLAYAPALSRKDVRLLELVWYGALNFTAPGALDDDVALVAGGRSVLSCAARSDLDHQRALQAVFLDDAVASERARVFEPDGCATPVPVEPWALCGDAPTLPCRGVGALLQAPGLRSLAALMVSEPRWRVPLVGGSDE